MSETVQAAKASLTQIADGWASLPKAMPRMGDEDYDFEYEEISRQGYRQTAAEIRTLLADHARLEGENESLREAIGLSSVDIFSDLMDLYADPHINRLTYAAAKAIVTAEESARQAEAALTDSRREDSELREGLADIARLADEALNNNGGIATIRRCEDIADTARALLQRGEQPGGGEQ